MFKAYSLLGIVTGDEKYEILTKEEDKKLCKSSKKFSFNSRQKGTLTYYEMQYAAMYEKVCSIYRKDNEQQMCNLLQEFFNYSYERGIDISLYISQLEKMAFRLKALNEHSNEMLCNHGTSTSSR